jgi:RNA polymerase sigma-70 factor, ECF subfamily
MPSYRGRWLAPAQSSSPARRFWLQSARENSVAADHDLASDKTWSQWMTAAQAGDRTAYERLLRDVVPFIRALASRRHRQPDLIEDVVQDVLLTVHRVRQTYDPQRPFRRWLGAIVERRSIDLLRVRTRTAAAEVSDERAYETFVDPAANREAEQRERAQGLSGAIAGLPSGQRQPVELLKLKEMSLAEASRASGKSISALKVNVHRAIAALRLKMRRDPE